MEPDSSSRDSIAYCEICLVKSTDIKEYQWNPVEELVITKKLCNKCGTSFYNKTQQLQSQLIARFHTRYIDWENTERTRRQMEQRQLALPRV
jgi:hypothetical protein